MELAEVEVRLAGSVANTVIRRNVTPAELVFLREMHGEAAIADVRYSGKRQIEQAKELERLRAYYNTENARPLFAKLFPGMTPQLPITFKEVGYEIGENETLRSKKKLQAEYQDELARKIKEAAQATGGSGEVEMIKYD